MMPSFFGMTAMYKKSCLRRANRADLQFLSEIRRCRRCAWMQRDDLVHVSRLQYLLYMLGGAGYSQLPSRFSYLAGRHDDNPNTRAVETCHSAKVKNDFFLALTNQVVHRPFQLLALPAESDSSSQFEHNDVGLHLLALNLQHRLDPLALSIFSGCGFFLPEVHRSSTGKPEIVAEEKTSGSKVLLPKRPGVEASPNTDLRFHNLIA